MMQRMKGGHVVITGGCGGIGGACAATFVREGASVHIIDMVRNEPLLTQLGDRARFTEMDVSVEAQWQSLTQGPDQGAPVDVLVNAVGISGLKNVEDADFAWWQRFQRINADSIFLSIHYLLPWLRAAPSAAIVNIGSTCAIRPTADLPAYSASKSAVRSLTKSVALHCAEKGYRIRCNAVHPGSTLTSMMEANLGTTAEERAANLQWRLDAHPYAKALGRLTQPQDIANAVLFLASEEAAFITGADLAVDGGATAFLPSG